MYNVEKMAYANQQSFNEYQIDEHQQSIKKWYEDLLKDPEDYKISSFADIQQMREEARIILENDTTHYKTKCSQGSSKSNTEWLHTMMTKGTSQDRIAASVVLIQNSPLHSLHIIRNLISLVKSNKKECVKAMDILTDLFISDLLIPRRKLRFFEKRPLSMLDKLSAGKALVRKTCLLAWHFEDQLKKEYYNFVSAIRDVSQGSVDINKEKSIIAMQKLLVAHSEQEVLLLSILVNKMGDPVLKVASKATFHLNKVLTKRPSMKVAVMDEIQKLLFRPNIGKRAQYYGVCFLSQFLLDNEEGELACNLVNLYFSFFKACVKRGDVDSRMMSALLSGINRAFPFSKKDELQIKDHIETMYKIVHIAHFNVSVQAMCLLFQVSDYDSAISDRFYSVLYQKIADPALSGSPQHAIFISLIFRSLSKDLQFNRVKTFIKRLLQICHYVPVPLVCGILLMVSHLFKKNKSLQCLTLFATEFAEDEGSGEERYNDIQSEEEDISNVRNEKAIPRSSEDGRLRTASWHHAANLRRKPHGLEAKKNAYSRNPLFVSDVSVYTELVSLSTHYHPTVSLFASRLLEGATIEYPGDPLRDFTLSRFLDRWVFKNPKELNENKISKLSRKHILLPSDVKSLPVNSEGYLNSPENLIPPEELFMYRFLKRQEAEGKGVRNYEDDSDVSSVASDAFEGMLAQLMGGKESIDYAEEINIIPGTNTSKQKKGVGVEDSEDSENDESGISDEDEIEFDEDDRNDNKNNEDCLDYSTLKEEFSDLDELDDDDKEILQFDENSDEDFEFTMSDVEKDEEERKFTGKRKRSISKEEKRKKKNKKGIDSGVFAPAEQFAEMLEDTGEQIAKYGNLTNVSNKDNAGIMQLKWERSRDRWVKGKNQRRNKNGKFKLQKKTRKQPNQYAIY